MGILVLGAMLLAGGLLRVDVPDNVYVVRVPGDDTVEVHVILPIPEAPAGLAHYVEHLAWLNAVGGQDRGGDRHSNAWANAGVVGYWLSGLVGDLPELVQSLNRIFEPLEVPDTFAEQEKDILLREYDMRMGANAARRADEKMNAFLYEGNPKAVSVLGSPQQIAALQYDNAKALHALTHRPEHARFVVIGDVSARALRRAFQPLGLPEPQPKDPQVFALAGEASNRFALEDDHRRFIWRRVVQLPAPVDFDLLETQAAVLRRALDTNLPGGLAGPLRFQAAITSRFWIDVQPLGTQHIEIRFAAEPDKGVSLMQVETAFTEVLAATSEAGLPPATFDRVLGRLETFWPDWDEARDVARWRAGYVLDRSAQFRTPLENADLRALHEQVTREQINSLLGSLAGPGRTATAFIETKGD